MRWLAVFLPAFAVEVHGRGGGAAPLAVTDGKPGRQVVAGCSPAAAAAGVTPGMSAATACALVPDLRLVPRDPVTEAGSLANLAAWAGQFSDMVSLEAGQGLVLESGRSLRLFGGGRRLGRLVREGAGALGYEARIALAPTARGSWWLARAAPGACVADGAALARRLATLPVDVMTLPDQAAAAFKALGLATVGDLMALSRDGLARRVGMPVLRQLDEALGRRPEARRPLYPPPRFHGQLDLPEPVLEQEALLFPLRRLLSELAGMLRGQGAGVAGFRVTLAHGAGEDSTVEVGLARPDGDGDRFLELLRHRLERLELAAPVERVAVDATAIRPLAPATADLFGTAGGQDERQEAELVDRLVARLGEQAVCGLAACPDHRPERAWRAVPFPGEGGGEDQDNEIAARPRWLLAEPCSLAALADGPVTAAELRFLAGPERIEGGWWDGQDVSRDYYVAETPAGRRLWVFRERRPPHRWRVHGLFA